MKRSMAAAGLALAAALVIGTVAEAQRGAAPAQPAQGRGGAPGRGAAPAGRGAQTPARYAGPRTPDGKPDLNGIWQALGTAHYNLEAHSASEGVPAGFSVVEGGAIPYKPEALAKRSENARNRLMADPVRKCYLP